jgi:hypothetical protein
MHARGACVINPPVGIDFLHGSYRLGASRHSLVRALGTQCKNLGLRLRWVAVVLWRVCRVIMPTVFSVDVLSRLARSDTNLLVLSSDDDLSPSATTARFNRFFSPRMVAPKGYVVTFVPGLDHSMLAAEGRARTIDLLERHVRQHFVETTPDDVSDHGAGEMERA